MIFIGAPRLFIRAVVSQISKSGTEPVLIYGAGHQGIALANSLMNSETFRPCAFIDDNRKKQNTVIHGLKVFQGLPLQGWFYARTGYTGEDGLEIMIPEAVVADFWTQLIEAGVQPCGLGARDTLRLEAGMNLYGNDMDEETRPLQAGMGWTIAWEPSDREFIGRTVLEAEKAAGVPMKQVGLVMETRGVMRSHQKVIVEGAGEGEVTSGTFSPTLQCSVAIARVPTNTGDTAQVDVRGKLIDVKVIKLPFVRNGKKLF